MSTLSLSLLTVNNSYLTHKHARTCVSTPLVLISTNIFNIKKQLNYKPGAASTELARRYKHLAGAKIRTVGEAFAQFNTELGYTVNPLYKNMVTDLVGTTHLIVVNARFTRDPVWCLGIIAALELLLKNYPEQDVAAKIVTALFNSVGMKEAEVRAEAKKVTDWVAAGQSKETIEAALSGQGQVGSPLAIVADGIKKDPYWMYSRYFGLGLVKIMEMIGIEMDKDEVYPVMEEWIGKKLGRSHLTACVSHIFIVFFHRYRLYSCFFSRLSASIQTLSSHTGVVFQKNSLLVVISTGGQ
jgi:Thylakoid formation protein